MKTFPDRDEESHDSRGLPIGILDLPIGTFLHRNDGIFSWGSPLQALLIVTFARVGLHCFHTVVLSHCTIEVAFAPRKKSHFPLANQGGANVKSAGVLAS